MTERERLIELLEHNRENPFETCPQYGTDDYCVGCKYDELDDCSTHRLADYLLANGVGVLSYNLHLPKEYIQTNTGYDYAPMSRPYAPNARHPYNSPISRKDL